LELLRKTARGVIIINLLQPSIAAIIVGVEIIANRGAYEKGHGRVEKFGIKKLFLSHLKKV
jgi:hypothetical protein